MPSPTLKAGYVCKLCKLDTFDVEVRERRTHEDVTSYAEYVMRRCAFHHRQNAPKCIPRTLDLKLPVSGNGIGFAGPDLTPEATAQMREQLKG